MIQWEARNTPANKPAICRAFLIDSVSLAFLRRGGLGVRLGGDGVIHARYQALAFFDGEVAIYAGQRVGLFGSIRPTDFNLVDVLSCAQTEVETEVVGRFETAAAHDIATLAHAVGGEIDR